MFELDAWLAKLEGGWGGDVGQRCERALETKAKQKREGKGQHDKINAIVFLYFLFFRLFMTKLIILMLYFFLFQVFHIIYVCRCSVLFNKSFAPQQGDTC